MSNAYIKIHAIKTDRTKDFPGCPVVKTSPFNAGAADSIFGQGAKIPYASQPKNQNRKTEAIL